MGNEIAGRERLSTQRKTPAVPPGGRLSGVGEDEHPEALRRSALSFSSGVRLAIGVQFGHREFTCRWTDKNGGSLDAGFSLQDSSSTAATGAALWPMRLLSITSRRPKPKRAATSSVRGRLARR